MRTSFRSGVVNVITIPPEIPAMWPLTNRRIEDPRDEHDITAHQILRRLINEKCR